ncbi:MAG: CvpA family protein [Lewinellaceae bacterium]|jgi:membrane protein required for colicin V production|nr:CvpA family protein [Lewinellaceae bacterium]
MPIDLLFIAAFGLGFRHGYTQGIINTVFNMLAYLFGIVLAFKITPTTTNILESLFNSKSPGMFIVAFLVNMGLIMFMLRAAASAIEKTLQAVYLGFFNRVLGGAIMAALSILIYSILLWFTVKVGFINDATIAQSRSYPILKDLPGQAKDVAIRFKPFATELWDSSLKWMDELDQYGLKKTETEPKMYQVPEDGKTGIETEPEQNTNPRQPSAADNGGIEE